MTKHFFLAELMSLIAIRLSVPLRILAIVLLFATSNAMAQNCDCPAAASCNTCSGGLTKLTLKYNGILPALISATDQGGVVFPPSLISSTMTFTFSGSIPNEKFQGPNVNIYVDGVFYTNIGTECGSAFPGNNAGSLFTIVSVHSKNGVVCCLPGTQDATPPVISNCPSSKTVNLAASACSTTVNWTPPSASDNCTVSSWTSTHTQNQTLFSPGPTTVSYTATDTYGNQSTCSFVVTVKDVTMPVFSGCPVNITTTADANCRATVSWTEPTATDNCNLVITKSHSPNSSFVLGKTTVTYTATDPSGNIATCSFDVVVQDKTPPSIVDCPADIKTTASNPNSCVVAVNWKVPTATDNCAPAPTPIPDKGPGDFSFGTTVVKYTATDAAGNKATCEFNVLVENPTNPVIEGCPATITESAKKHDDSVSVSWVEPIASVKCGQYTVEKSHEPGDNFPVGRTPVSYTVTDETGRSSTCTFDVVILDSDVMFTVSNVVTPDGDGINDVWIIPNIDDFKNNTVVVLDRWGNKIFQANGYDNIRTVWNGTKNGTAVPTGTYFYTIEVRDQDKIILRKGFIEVIQ